MFVDAYHSRQSPSTSFSTREFNADALPAENSLQALFGLFLEVKEIQRLQLLAKRYEIDINVTCWKI